MVTPVDSGLPVEQFAYGSHGRAMSERWMMNTANHLPAPDGLYVRASAYVALMDALTAAQAELAENEGVIAVWRRRATEAEQSLTAAEKRIAELVGKDGTDETAPTPEELKQWLAGDCAAAVRAFRTRLNCGLREAVDSFRKATP